MAPMPNTLRDALFRERRLQQQLFRLSAEVGSAKRHLQAEAAFGNAEHEEVERLQEALARTRAQAEETLQHEERSQGPVLRFGGRVYWFLHKGEHREWSRGRRQES